MRWEEGGGEGVRGVEKGWAADVEVAAGGTEGGGWLVVVVVRVRVKRGVVEEWGGWRVERRRVVQRWQNIVVVMLLWSSWGWRKWDSLRRGEGGGECNGEIFWHWIWRNWEWFSVVLA